MMVVRILLLLPSVVFFSLLQAQPMPSGVPDHAEKPEVQKHDTLVLQEVQIYVTDNESAEFSFYRSNKLATTEELLSRMQGVNLIRRGAYGMEPALRGYSSGQTNITIDGMRIYGACTDKMDPVSIYIEPTNLQAIQVNHGATGALAGSTIGGQIDMRLKEPQLNCHATTSARFAQSFSTVNTSGNTSVWFQQSFRKIAYRVSGVYRKAGNYMAADHQLVHYSGYEKSNLNAVVLWAIDSLQQIKLDYLGDWGRNIGYPALPMDVKSADARIFAATHRWHSGRGLLKSSETKVYYNAVTHRMDDTHRSHVPMHMDMPGWSETRGFFNETQWGRYVQVRADFHRAYTLAEMTMYPAGEPLMYMQTLPANILNDAGIRLGYMRTFHHQSQININGRIDLMQQHALDGIGAMQWDVFNVDVRKKQNDVLKNLNITCTKAIQNAFTLQLSTGYGERLPTSNERYGFYLFNRQDGYDYVGNINLKPEKALQTELLFKMQRLRFNMSVNLFYHRTFNYIYAYRLDGLSQMTIGALGLKTYRNITYAVMKGFECAWKGMLTAKSEYIASVKYTHATTFTGQPLPLIPPLKWQQSLRYELYNINFQAEHDMSLAQTRVNTEFGDKKTPAYNLVNLRMSRNFTGNHCTVQLAFACENVFDVCYHEHLDIGGIARPGRNFLLNASILF